MKKIVVGLSLFLTAAVIQPTSAQQVINTAPSLEQVSDGVLHYWEAGHSSLVVVGNDGVLVVDPANSGRAANLLEEIKAFTDKPVTHVALSHEHYNYVGGTEIFEGAKILCQASCEALFELSVFMPVPKEVHITYDKKYELDLGGKTVQLRHPAIGDGNATTVYRVLGDGVVYSADLYGKRNFSPPLFQQDKNPVGIRKILHVLKDWKPTYAINGHQPGNSLENLHEAVELHDKLFNAVTSEIKSALSDGGPQKVRQLLFSISSKLKMEEYKDWKGYEQGFPAYVDRMMQSIIRGG